MPSSHLILCHPLLLLPSIFPSIRVFSSESGLHIRWPKYWSFIFSISLSNEYSGLISFRMDWLDLLAVQGTLKSLLQHHSSEASILQHSAFSWSNSHIHTWLLEVKVAQSCLTLCDPMDYTVHGILQARRLEWVALLFSRGSSQLRDQIQVSGIAGRFFTSWATITTGKTIALTRQTFVSKVISLLFNMLSRMVISFLSRSKHLLISWLQSPPAVILEPKKIKSATVSIVSPSICYEMMGPDAMIFVFWMLSFKPTFSLSSFTFIKRLFSSSLLSAIRVVSSAYLSEWVSESCSVMSDSLWPHGL